MDQGNTIFRGNADDLLKQMQISYEQFQSSVRLSEPFSRPLDMHSLAQGTVVGYDIMSALPDTDVLLKEIPFVRGLEEELLSSYNYYCTYGDRLNVGPHALIKRSQFHRLLKNARMLDLHTLRPSDVDVILERRLGKGVTKMNFDEFIFVLVATGARRIPTMPWLASFFFTVLSKLLPSSERLAQMHTSGAFSNGGSMIDVDYWTERELKVKELRLNLLDPAVMDLFNVVEEQLQEFESLVSNADDKNSWKLFLDDNTVKADGIGGGMADEPVPMPSSAAMGSAAFIGTPSATTANDHKMKEEERIENGTGTALTPNPPTPHDNGRSSTNAADVGRMLSGLSVNGHKLTRDADRSRESYMVSASSETRQMANRRPDEWPMRTLMDQRMKQLAKPDSPFKKKVAVRPDSPSSPEVKRTLPTGTRESMKSVIKERDDAKRENEHLRRMIHQLQDQSTLVMEQVKKEEEEPKDVAEETQMIFDDRTPTAEPLSMESWQAAMLKSQSDMESNDNGDSAHFTDVDVNEDDTAPSATTESARHSNLESSTYPYPSVTSPTSPVRGFGSAAFRLYEAADKSKSGTLTTRQLIVALQEHPALAEALGFPEDTKWDFVVGYCHSESGDISLTDFIDKLPVLRGAAQYQAAMEDRPSSPFRASQVVSPAKSRQITAAKINAAMQRDSNDRLSRPRNTTTASELYSPRRIVETISSPRRLPGSASRKNKTHTLSPFMSPQMTSSTRKKREPNLSGRSRSDEFWAVQRREEQRAVSVCKGSRMESRSPPKVRASNRFDNHDVQLMTRMSPTVT